MLTPRGAVAGAAVGGRVFAIEGLVEQPTTTCCLGSSVVEALDVPGGVPRTSHAAGACLARRSAIGPANIGRVRLGRRRRQLLRLRVKPARRTRHTFRYCVKRSSGAVTAVFGRDGRGELVTTTARGYGNRGVRVGSSYRRLVRAYARRRRIDRGLYRASPRSRRLFGVRRGRVRVIAVTERRLLRRREALRRALARG